MDWLNGPFNHYVELFRDSVDQFYRRMRVRDRTINERREQALRIWQIEETLIADGVSEAVARDLAPLICGYIDTRRKAFGESFSEAREEVFFQLSGLLGDVSSAAMIIHELQVNRLRFGRFDHLVDWVVRRREVAEMDIEEWSGDRSKLLVGWLRRDIRKRTALQKQRAFRS